MHRGALGLSIAGSTPAHFRPQFRHNWSNEGLSIGVDLTVRWAIDRGRIAQMSKEYPDDLNTDLVRPALQGIVYPLFARHSVREIFSDKRAQIQQTMTSQLAPKLAAAGLVLKGVDMGNVDLPRDFRAGMERLLAEELETEKMRYTLQLKEAHVKQTQLESQAEAVRRREAAEAAALGLTRPDCIDPNLGVVARAALDEERRHLLEMANVRELSAMTKSRIHARRAAVWASSAFERARRGQPAAPAAQRALTELLSVKQDDLGDDRRTEYVDTVVREAKERGVFRRRFEVLRIDDLALIRFASTPALLRDFGRWQDAAWRRDTLAMH